MPNFPVTAGRWSYTSKGAVCQLPLRRLRVNASPAFLRALHGQCDGKTPWETVRRSMADRWPVKEIEHCTQLLVKAGVLVEASAQLAVQAQIGWTPQVLKAPLIGPADLHALASSARAHLRTPPNSGAKGLKPLPTPLSRMLLDRKSTRTFADQPLTLQSMVNVLWALYGVIADDGSEARRTVPSGGALYGLRWFMALMREVDDYPSGLYEIVYSADGTAAGEVLLRRHGGDPNSAWQTLLTPTVLTFAHMVIYSFADLGLVGQKYGNRALTLAMLEAGHALQNGGLAAMAEGASSIVRGDTVEMEVRGLFPSTANLYPLPALIVGVRPEEKAIALAEAAHARVGVRIVPNHTLGLALSTRVASVGPIEVRGRHAFTVWATGRSTDPRLAVVKAEAEAWERIGWTSPEGIVHARRSELGNAIDPTTLVSYLPAQYARPDFPFLPWSEQRKYPWVEGIDLNADSPVSLMAQCVYALSALSERDTRYIYTNASTSGIAAYTDAQSALYRALVELVERDAFARVWMNHVPPVRLRSASLPKSAQVRIQRLVDAGYMVTVHQLPSRYLPVLAIFSQSHDAAFTSLTTASAFDMEAALDSALCESESRVQQHHASPRPTLFKASEVVTAGNHGDYFRNRRNFRKADWLANDGAPENWQALARTNASAMPFAGSGKELVGRLIDDGNQLHLCNLTPEGAAINQGRTPLFVIRAFASGLMPLWFGYGMEPMGLSAAQSVRAGRRPPRTPLPIHPCT